MADENTNTNDTKTEDKPDLETVLSQFNELKSENEKFVKKYEIEKEHRKNAESKLRETEQEREAAIEKARTEALEEAKKSGKTEDLDKSWQMKYDSDISKLKHQLESERSKVNEITAGREARELAVKVFGPDNADIVMPHVSPMVSVEFNESGQHSFRYLDEQGKPTAFNRDEIADQLANKFPTLAIGSKASGGGANGSNSKGSGATQKSIKRDEFFSKPEAERKQLMRDKVQFV